MTLGKTHLGIQKRIELDRETWAGLDKIDYHILVEGRGEAIVGPFYFGRAFDAPPFFTFSAVATNNNPGVASQLTVGVDEWIIDDQEMYVGAYLWFAFDSCFEPYVSSYVEDFENILSRQGGGPLGDEIPASPNVGGYEIGWPSKNQAHVGQSLDNPLVQWATQRVEGTKTLVDLHVRGVHPYTTIQNDVIDNTVDPRWNNWKISSANPRPNTGGKYHLRREHSAWSGAPGQPDFVAVHIGNTFPCILPDNETLNADPNRPFPWDFRSITILPFFRIQEGMVLDVSMDAMINQIDGDDQVKMYVAFYDEDANFIGDSGKNASSFFMSTSWTTHHMTIPIVDWGGLDSDTETDWPQYHDLVPSTQDIRYCSVNFECVYSPVSPPYNAKTWDMDNLKVEISGNIPTFSKPAFRVALNFDGQVLKNYANIHPLRSYEYPNKVVLR